MVVLTIGKLHSLSGGNSYFCVFIRVYPSDYIDYSDAGQLQRAFGCSFRTTAMVKKKPSHFGLCFLAVSSERLQAKG